MNSMVLDGANPRSRNSDPITSVDAGRLVELTINQAQSQVLSLLYIHGALADHELVTFAHGWNLKGSPQRFRTARAHLVQAGQIEAVEGEYRLTEHGHKAQVWCLTDASANG